MTIHKAWSHAGTSGFSAAGLIAKLKSAIKFEIPTGYQDETGFHTGVKAAQKDIEWPTTW
jgi:peptide subunit release factor 1 (eRF1)